MGTTTSIPPTTVRLPPVTKARIEKLVNDGHAKNVSQFIMDAIDRYFEVCEQ